MPELQWTRIGTSKVKTHLDAVTEATLLVGVEWWVEEVSLKIKTSQQFLGSPASNQASMKPFKKKKPTLIELRNTLNIPGAPALDYNFLMDNYNILIWNCKGAGNDQFKQNFSDMCRQHEPEVVALLETKVSLSSMGLFFKKFGYTRDTYSDPNGRF